MNRYFTRIFLKSFKKGNAALRLSKTLFLGMFLLYTLSAWVYPEHRQILLFAIQNLSPDYRQAFEKLWKEARMGYEGRLTESVIDTAQGVKPKQLDYASWAAIAGDHSCSPQNLLDNVLKTEWILNVADVAAQLKIDIENSKNNAQHINAIRNSDIRLQRADLEYATRAGSNNVHFLLPRTEINISLNDYLDSCFIEGAPLNALGAYAMFHKSALLKASKYADGNLSQADKSALILSALADEAFALHFLEDVFAAGHIAGTRGNASLRKGTHDYYNEHGLEVVSWNGTRKVNMGDAYMTEKDAKAASIAVGLSLEQLIKATEGKQTNLPKNNIAGITNRPDSFSVCANSVMPAGNYDVQLFNVVMLTTPVPGLATGTGELPRFRAELGTFWGISSGIDASAISGAFGKQQLDAGAVGGLEANVRFGLGLDGVLNKSGDGLVFLQVGWRQDAYSSNKFINHDASVATNSLTSAIPGRTAYNVRIRLPFWLIPGDLILAAPFLIFTAPKTYAAMAVTAANGGLIPWQLGMATNHGRFQFILGREVGFSFYGLGDPKDAMIIPQEGSKSYLVEYKSTKIDFPVVEYKTMSSFSQNQSSDLLFQLGFGVDIPHGAGTLLPAEAPVPELKNVWYIGLRIMFNWRHY